jgi:hypothetical protein
MMQGQAVRPILIYQTPMMMPRLILPSLERTEIHMLFMTLLSGDPPREISKFQKTYEDLSH